MLAPVITGAVLLLWLVALAVKLGDRRLLNNRSKPESVRSRSWQEFERLVGEAFRRQGYVVAQTQAGADGGVDLILDAKR
jgi:restriction system protein